MGGSVIIVKLDKTSSAKLYEWPFLLLFALIFKLSLKSFGQKLEKIENLLKAIKIGEMQAVTLGVNSF